MSPIMRLNLRSETYTGNQTFPADKHRGYFLIHMIDATGTIELGGGGGLLPIAIAGTYEPLVAPISEIAVVTAGTFIVVWG